MGEKNERDPEREPSHYSAINVSVLGEVERDLRFYPCGRARDPEVLSREQIDAFNRDGCLAGIRAFDSGEIAEHRRYFHDLLAGAKLGVRTATPSAPPT